MVISQFVDANQDGFYDNLLFHPDIDGNSEMTFNLRSVNKGDRFNRADTVCYSRFVPERTDDYAWENDKVAFRTYGPSAQRMVEEGIKGGTLSSGIDCWLKKVEYPIINKWYEASRGEDLIINVAQLSMGTYLIKFATIRKDGSSANESVKKFVKE